MLFRQLFDPASSTYTYLLADTATRKAVLIDPVLDQVERDVALIGELGLELVHTLDTHVHADHITGSGMLTRRLGSKSVLSERGGSPYADVFVKDGDIIEFGGLTLEVRETPGHTNGCVTYVLGDKSMAFTGDALLIRGSGRTDFQQGDPHKLYRSITEQILTLPDETLLYPGHDYKGLTVTTVWEEKKFNKRLGGGKTEEQFVDIMHHLKLAKPVKIDEAVPANLYGGMKNLMPASGEPHPERGWAPIVRTAAGVPEVTPDWLSTHATDMMVVDVRQPDEFVGPLGHVAGSKLVPLATLLDAAKAWDHEQPIVAVCRSGGRSGRAALDLEGLGFKRVASMAGGMTLWNEKKLPIEVRN